MPIQTTRRAFTLIEVLVVISIIGVLVATLLPALGEARNTAKDNTCLTNIRAQFNAQFVYATDNNGRFSEHIARLPSYYKDIFGKGPADRLRPSYLPDGKVFICPFNIDLGDYFANPAATIIVGPFEVGGWNATGPTTQIVGGPYSWFANFTSKSTAPATPTDSVTYYPVSTSNGYIFEPTWPRNTSECTSEQTVIAHLIQKALSGGGGDTTHGYKDVYFTGARPSGRSAPVTLGDGHAVNRKTQDMLERALIVTQSGNQYTHWY